MSRRLTRRTFIKSTAAAAAITVIPSCLSRKEPAGPKPFDRPISFQSYGMKSEIEKDFPGTLRKVRELGFSGVEMCSPISYKEAGFGNLTPLPPAEIKRQIKDSGLLCKTSHFQAHEMLGDATAKSTEYGAAMGLTDIIMSGAGVPRNGTLDDYKKFAASANKAGQIVKAAGLRLGYHNHSIGPEFDGKPLYDSLMEMLEPDLVTMQFQIASITGGYDIIAYLEKYAGRYSALHMHDWDPQAKSPNPDRTGKIVPIGEGIVDWVALLKAANKSNIADHGFIIEIESRPPDSPFEGLRRSINYLRTLKI
ncbi:MAG: sugar phosphate isomerase/epimerase [Planctomycetes bacterium]|nr:sugar phosphate isomerase/epimerase [Planctomycetota bacterium]